MPMDYGNYLASEQSSQLVSTGQSFPLWRKHNSNDGHEDTIEYKAKKPGLK